MSNQGVDQKANRTDVILNLWKKIGKPEKAAMLSALFIGILTHLFMITNKLPNWDDVAVIPTTGLGPYIGRWEMPRRTGFPSGAHRASMG